MPEAKAPGWDDKALLNWRGQTLLQHMVARLQTVADPVHVVGRAPLLDRLRGLGPLSGIATGLEATFTDANLFVAVDLPFLTQEFLEYLRSRLEHSTRPLLACKIGSAFPLCWESGGRCCQTSTDVSPRVN